jgi:hypothetical protein
LFILIVVRHAPVILDIQWRLAWQLEAVKSRDVKAEVDPDVRTKEIEVRRKTVE